MFLSGVLALPDTQLTGALAEYLHGGPADVRVVGWTVAPHYISSDWAGTGGCQAHYSVANLPSLAPGCGDIPSPLSSQGQHHELFPLYSFLFRITEYPTECMI